MQNINQKLNKLGFNRSHYLVALSAVLIFSALVIPKTGFSVSGLFAKAEDETSMLTYEDVHSQVYAKYNLGDDEKYLADLQNQFALLDRGQVDGAVLGEAIGVGTVPSAEQVFTRDLLEQVDLKLSTDNSKLAIQKYSESLLGIEADGNGILSLANLNSADLATIQASKENPTKVIVNLSNMTVPSQLADFHRYKMIYYQNIIAMTDAFSKQGDDQNLQNQAAIFLSVTEKLEQLKLQVWDNYQVQL